MMKIVGALALIVGVCAPAFGATTQAANVVRMTTEGDTYSAGGAALPPVCQIQLTPVTTGTVFRLREASASGKVVWETTSTETRPITDAGIVVTAVGGLDKIVEDVTIGVPTGGFYLEIDGTDPATWTGIYLYFRKDN